MDFNTYIVDLKKRSTSDSHTVIAEIEEKFRLNKTTFNELIILQGKMHRLEQERRCDLISYDEAQRSFNKNLNHLLQFIDHLQEGQLEELKKLAQDNLQNANEWLVMRNWFQTKKRGLINTALGEYLMDENKSIVDESAAKKDLHFITALIFQFLNNPPTRQEFPEWFEAQIVQHQLEPYHTEELKNLLQAFASAILKRAQASDDPPIAIAKKINATFVYPAMEILAR